MLLGHLDPYPGLTRAVLPPGWVTPRWGWWRYAPSAHAKLYLDIFILQSPHDLTIYETTSSRFLAMKNLQAEVRWAHQGFFLPLILRPWNVKLQRINRSHHCRSCTSKRTLSHSLQRFDNMASRIPDKQWAQVIEKTGGRELPRSNR